MKRVERDHAERFLLVAFGAVRAGEVDSPKEALKYRRMAVELGAEVSPRVLNRIYPDLGTIFSEKLVKSLELGNRAAETRDPVLLQQAYLLEKEWRDWYNPRLAEVSASIKRCVPADAFQK